MTKGLSHGNVLTTFNYDIFYFVPLYKKIQNNDSLADNLPHIGATTDIIKYL